MKTDHIDELQADWTAQGAELDPDAMGVVLRIQALARVLTDQAGERLEAFGLPYWQYDVLSALRRQGSPYTLSASELAEAGMLSSGAMTTRIDRMLEAGLVRRRRDAHDRRRVLVSLTNQGLQMVESASRARFEAAVAAQETLSAEQRSQLNGLLRELLAAQ